MGKMLAEAGVGPDRVRAVLSEAPAAPDGRRPRATGTPRPGTGGPPGQPGDARPPARRRRTSRRERAELPWRLVLLLAVPVSIVLGYVVHAPAVWVFLTACLGVLPLAGYMGEATEHLAHRTGPTIGGLLNATFGNAAELIIAIVALRAGLVDLVKASITGSILGNLLLILGLALMAGGLNRAGAPVQPHQRGHERGHARARGGGAGLPGAVPLGSTRRPPPGVSELRMSEAVAVILIVTYGCSLLFTLRTHRRLFGGEAHPLDGPVWSVGQGDR